MVQVWKILHGKGKVDEKIWFERLFTHNQRNTRATASEFNLVVPKSNLEVRRQFFSSRVTKVWNDLPENIKIAPSVTSFKSTYDNWKKMQRGNRALNHL